MVGGGVSTGLLERRSLVAVCQLVAQTTKCWLSCACVSGCPLSDTVHIHSCTAPQLARNALPCVCECVCLAPVRTLILVTEHAQQRTHIGVSACADDAAGGVQTARVFVQRLNDWL